MIEKENRVRSFKRYSSHYEVFQSNNHWSFYFLIEYASLVFIRLNLIFHFKWTSLWIKIFEIIILKWVILFL